MVFHSYSGKVSGAESKNYQEETAYRASHGYSSRSMQRPASFQHIHDGHGRIWKAIMTLMLIFILCHYYLATLFAEDIVKSAPRDHAPALHFTTPTTSHNAILGLFIDDNQVWHIYHQATPETGEHANGTRWTHAISNDLYTWSAKPDAFRDDHVVDNAGSIVIDRNNTSGLFPKQSNGIVAIYSKFNPETKSQRLAIAYSIDGGCTFTRSPNDPIVLSKTMDQGIQDLQIMWYEESRQWIMTATTNLDARVVILTSWDLTRWDATSEIAFDFLGTTSRGLELPSLVSIPRINTTGAENKNRPTVPGGVVEYFGDYMFLASWRTGSPLNGGSVTRYFPGTFNGTHFQPLDERTDRYIDVGPDNWGYRFFWGLPDGQKVVGLGSATNIANADLEESKLDSIFTIPREGYLIREPGDGELSYFSRPVGLDKIVDGTLASMAAHNLSGSSVIYESSEAVLVELKFDMQPPDDEVVELNVDYIFGASKDPGHVLCTIVFNTWTADFGCDRSNSKYLKSSPVNVALERMAALQVRPFLPVHNPAVRRWKIQLIIDQGILEAFWNDGVRAGTLRTPPELLLDRIHFQTSTIPEWASLNLTVQQLRPA